MPQWDSSRDQKLFLMILDAHPTLAVDYKKVAEAWAKADENDHPTPRAIRERLGVIRKQASLSSSTRKTGSNSKRKSTADIKVEADDEDVHDPQTPPEKLSFIRSSFPTPFRATNKSGKNGSGGKKRKRLGDSSDEEEAMSSGGSDSEVSISGETPTKLSNIRASARRRSNKPKYDLQDLQDTTNDESMKPVHNDSDSDSDSDEGYDPVKIAEEKRTADEKRARSRKGRKSVAEESE